jgi:taurine dioxygenase
MSDATFAALRKAWLDANGVLVICGQTLTPEQQIAFSRRFGPLKHRDTHRLHESVEHPEIVVVSNKVVDGKRLGRISGVFWHSDSSYDTAPVSATLLYGLEVPPAGGDTMFANQYLAYDTLSPKMKVLLRGLKAVNDYYNPATYSNRQQVERPSIHPPVIHPIVRRHPETGRDALYITRGFTSSIVGLPAAEGDAILEFLFNHSTQPEFIYRHHWQPRDLVIWDNRCLQHYAVNDYDGIFTRCMHRTSVQGDAPVDPGVARQDSRAIAESA